MYLTQKDKIIMRKNLVVIMPNTEKINGITRLYPYVGVRYDGDPNTVGFFNPAVFCPDNIARYGSDVQQSTSAGLVSSVRELYGSFAVVTDPIAIDVFYFGEDLFGGENE